MKIVEKIWGNEEWIVNNGLYCGKRMTLRKGAFCSLHMHPKKHETFYVEKGKIRIEHHASPIVNLVAKAGSCIEIPPGTFHRFAGYVDSVFFEFSTQHDDNDVVRKEKSFLSPILYVFDVDGTLINSGGIVDSQHIRKSGKFGVLSSRSRDRSLSACNELGVAPDFIMTCRIMQRAEELQAIDRMFPLRRTVYVADQSSDREESHRAGWQHMYPTEFANLMMEE